MGQARGRKASWDPVVYVALGTLASGALVALSGCGGAHSPYVITPTEVVVEPVRHARVVVLTVDGLRPDAVVSANSPNILTLAARGASTSKAQTVFPPWTLPAHASLLSGYGPDRHLIKWDDYAPEKGFITVPTVLSVAGQAGRRAVAVIGKSKLQHLNAPGCRCTFILAPRETDEEVANQAVYALNQGDFDLMFIHMPSTDITGHAMRWMSVQYLATFNQADAAIGRILSAVPPDATVIVTADHGGNGTDHSAQVALNMTVPWIIAGPAVKVGYSLSRPVNVKDTASTVAYLLGLVMPSDLEGRPVFEAFAGAESSAASVASAALQPLLLSPPKAGPRGPSPRGRLTR
jgi:type I phosphodiesterase/nucleotide pyrophosphatase